MSDEPKPSVRLFSYEDDTPQISRGALIPRSIAIDEISLEPVGSNGFLVRSRRVFTAAVMPVVSMAALALVVFAGYNIATSVSQVASAPTITIYDPYSTSRTTLATGPQEAFSQSAFFTEARDALIEQNQTFLEIDLVGRTVRYFDEGVLLLSAEAKAIGEQGSWWDVPSGLYEVASVEEKHFSQYTQTYFPWTILFEGNYAVHGWPEYPNGDTVPENFVGGGVRLDTAEAEKFYQAIEPRTTVIVRGIPAVSDDSFVYEPVGPQITAKEYLVADVENGTILTASDIDRVVPIASLTKLMTAIVAAEKMSLEKRVYAASPTFVDSLIPRLRERSSVSMYSLLQLLLVESSNEAAEVIASTYGRDDFIIEMNNKARLVGMFDTTFADPSGLSAENTSTVHDLFTLTRHIYNQRNFIFEITQRGEAVGVEGGGDFTGLTNFNEVEDLSSFIGGKIGETEAAGKTSVSLHRITVDGEERTVAVVILGSEARNDDVKALLSYVSVSYN